VVGVDAVIIDVDAFIGNTQDFALGYLYNDVETCNLGANDDDADVRVYFLNSNKKNICKKSFAKRAKKQKKKRHTGVLGGSWVSAILSMYWMGEQVRHM
jgi:hypothetical protein